MTKQTKDYILSILLDKKYEVENSMRETRNDRGPSRQAIQDIETAIIVITQIPTK